MVADTSPEPLSLAEILTSVARRASDRQLIAMAATGIFGAVALELLLGRKGWLGAAGALAVGAYGAWSITDRRLNQLWSVPGSSRSRTLPLRVARAASAVVGTLAALALMASIFIPVIEGWKS
jgi:hypothetical protein